MINRQIKALVNFQVATEIRFILEGKDRLLVMTPFRFNNCDHLKIVLKQQNLRIYQN